MLSSNRDVLYEGTFHKVFMSVYNKYGFPNFLSGTFIFDREDKSSTSDVSSFRSFPSTYYFPVFLFTRLSISFLIESTKCWALRSYGSMTSVKWILQRGGLSSPLDGNFLIFSLVLRNYGFIWNELYVCRNFVC